MTSVQIIANPAVTVARAFSDTFAGIAPGSVPAFAAAQVVGAVLAAGTIRYLYPETAPAADDAILAHPNP